MSCTACIIPTLKKSMMAHCGSTNQDNQSVIKHNNKQSSGYNQQVNDESQV